MNIVAEGDRLEIGGKVSWCKHIGPIHVEFDASTFNRDPLGSIFAAPISASKDDR